MKVQLGPLQCTLLDDGEPPRRLVVLCHGYGAPGDDLVGLESELRRVGGVPGGTRWVFPEAPLEVPLSFGGRATSGARTESHPGGNMQRTLTATAARSTSASKRFALAALVGLMSVLAAPVAWSQGAGYTPPRYNLVPPSAFQLRPPAAARQGGFHAAVQRLMQAAPRNFAGIRVDGSMTTNSEGNRTYRASGVNVCGPRADTNQIWHWATMGGNWEYLCNVTFNNRAEANRFFDNLVRQAKGITGFSWGSERAVSPSVTRWLQGTNPQRGVVNQVDMSSCPRKGWFATIFLDITPLKRMEKQGPPAAGRGGARGVTQAACLQVASERTWPRRSSSAITATTASVAPSA